MTIRVSTPSGANIEFPDGTDAQTIASVLGRAHGQTGAPSAPGALQSGIEGFGQGVTLNTSDEMEGAARAAYAKLTGSEPGPNADIEHDDQDRSFNALYSRYSGEARARQATEATAHPIAYHGGEIAGAVGGAVALGGAGVGIRGAASLGARTLTGASEGGIYGALYGAGGAEPGQRTSGAVQGAVGGAVLGGATPALVDVGSSALGSVTRPLRGYLQPRDMANEKVGEALARDFGGSLSVRQTQTALDRINTRSAAAATDKPMMLADFGGENTRNLLRSAANMPNDRVQALNSRLNARQGNQWRRIEGDMAQGLGNPDDYATTVGNAIEARTQAARPAFQAAMAVETPMTPQLNDVLQRPLMRRVIQGVQDNQANEGSPVGLATRTEALHRVKLEIDNQINAARRAATMGTDRTATTDVRTLSTLKSDLLSAIDNPTYKDALRDYADRSALINAAEDGFDRALKMHTEEIAPHLDSLTPGEQDMWRLGAARALAGKIRTGNVTRDRTEGVFSSPDIQQRMNALFPDNASRREFQKNLVLEAKMADTRKAVQGNSTTAKQLMQAQEAGNPSRAISAVANAATGRFEALLSGLARVGQRFSGMTPATANATIDTLMQQAGGGTLALGNAMRASMLHADQVPANRAQLSNALIAGSQAGLVGRQTVGPDQPPWDPYANR